MPARKDPMANVRAIVAFELIPMSVAAPLSSDTAIIAHPSFVLLTNRVSAIITIIHTIIVTIASAVIVSSPLNNLRGGIFIIDVKLLVFAPKIRSAIFCKK